MGPVAGVLAGIATIGGAVALYRFARRKGEALKRTIEEVRRQNGDQSGEVLDFERDPGDGVYRAR